MHQFEFCGASARSKPRSSLGADCREIELQGKQLCLAKWMDERLCIHCLTLWWLRALGNPCLPSQASRGFLVGECLWPNQQQRKALGKSGDEQFRLLTIARNCEDMVVPRPKYPHKHLVSTSVHLKAETEAATPVARPTGSDAGQQMEKRLLGWSNSTWLIPPIELNTYNCYTGKTKAPTKTPLKTGSSSKW